METINRLTCSGIFLVKLTFENPEMSEMNPRDETSTVLFKSLHVKNSGYSSGSKCYISNF